MTTAQTKMFFTQWRRVRKALTEFGDFSPADADAERKLIQHQALGCDKSSKDFSNRDLNKVLDAFDKILVLFDGPSTKPTRNASNLIYSISKLGLDDPYLNKIAADQFQVSDWRKLSESQLTLLRYTATNRARSFTSSPAPA